MYSKFSGSPAADSGATDGQQLWSGSPPETLTGGGGNDVLGGRQGDTLIGGDGNDTYYLNGSNIRIVEASNGGTDTVVTFANYILPDNVENLKITGDGLIATGNGLDNIISVGDSNNMTLYGAGGSDVLVGGTGNDVFVVKGGEGDQAIYRWHAGDRLRLVNSDLTNFAQVKAAMHQAGADVVIENRQTHIVIRDMQTSQLGASDFQLGVDSSKLGAMTFDDEFNALSLGGSANPSGIWRPDYKNSDTGSLGNYTLASNGELQVYTSPGFHGSSGRDLGLDPFSIDKGVLTITARHTGASSDYWDYAYTSGALTTRDSFSQTYGYFEMRAELPHDTAGAWPAFWLVPADGSWPPELDVMEELGGDASQVFVTAHSNVGDVHTSQGAVVLNPGGNDGGFHTYGVLWTPTDLIWYVDGTEAWSAPTPADMHKPMYMIANLAVGGFAGPPSDWSSAAMKVDYVHAYALAGQPAGAEVVGPGGPPVAPISSVGAYAPSLIDPYSGLAHYTLQQLFSGFF